MDLWTVILSALGPTATVGLAIWSDRRARERDRKQQAEKAEQDREQQLEQVKGLLQTMVVDRVEVAFGEIAKHERRITEAEKAHAHLRGFLQGKGCVIPDLCPDDPSG